MLLFLKNYQPFLIDPNKTPHLNDWLLDITGSLMIVFLMPLMMLLITFTITKQLWTGFGSFIFLRFKSRAALMKKYCVLILINASCLVLLVFFLGWLLAPETGRESVLSDMLPFENNGFIVVSRLLTLWLTLVMIGLFYLMVVFKLKSIGITFAVIFAFNGILYASARDAYFLPWWFPGKMLFLPVYWQQNIPLQFVNLVYALETIVLFFLTKYVIKGIDFTVMRRKR